MIYYRDIPISGLELIEQVVDYQILQCQGESQGKATVTITKLRVDTLIKGKGSAPSDDVVEYTMNVSVTREP